MTSNRPPALVSVVVPVFNNAETLRLLMMRLCSMALPLSDSFEFIFVDDGSTDASHDILAASASADQRVRVLKLSRNFGSNAAIVAGMTHAQGACVVAISADLQDPPELIQQLLERWHTHSDVVLAARRRRADPALRRVWSAVFNRLFRRLAFRDFPPNGFDVFLLDRRVMQILVSMGERNSYLFGQVMWVGFRRAVVAYDRVAREGGRSGWSTEKRIKYFVDAFVAFSCAPFRLASGVGVALTAAAVVCAGRLAWTYAVANADISTGQGLLVLILLTSGIQLLMLGILGEYLWRALDAARGRPLFVVESSLNVHQPPRADDGA